MEDGHTARTTAIVVHRDQPDRCVATAKALRGQGVAIDLVIVDNGSSAVNIGRLRDEIAGARVIEVGRNIGFGPAANVGLRDWLEAGTSDWAVLTPHDALPDSGCLAALTDATAHRPRAGLVCAEFGDETKPVVDRFFGGITLPALPGDGWESTGFVHGTLMALRRDCLRDIGLFAEDYFAYCEEADLAMRARAQGWEVGMVWGAIVRNPHQSTASAAIDYLMLRNSLVLVHRHFGWYNATIRFVMGAVTAAWLSLRPSRRTPWYSFRARRWALFDFLRGHMGPPPVALTRGAISS